MKNVFKFLGIALIASSLVFVSCAKEEENTTNNNGTENNGGENNGGNTDQTVATCTFDGTTWTAAYNVAKHYGSYSVVLVRLAEAADASTYPIADVAVSRDATGTYTDTYDGSAWANDVVNYIEYYEETYLTDGTYQYGDWWAESANINITKADLTAGKLTATINCGMFKATEALVEGGDFATASRCNMTVNVQNVDYSEATK